LESGSVDVSFEKSRSPAALVVPVTALLALAEGGYAVQVADSAGDFRLIGVKVGTIAGEFAAVSSTELNPGALVAVPS
jgi:membrane fusion protein, multidrug efflux system